MSKKIFIGIVIFGIINILWLFYQIVENRAYKAYIDKIPYVVTPYHNSYQNHSTGLIEPINKRQITMEEAIITASEEFGVPSDLIIGIANAESGLGKYFYNEYDRNCHNWWGLKGGNMELRNDGSYLRCFNDELSGARTVAKTLKIYYIDEGRDTPEKICKKWIGGKFSKTHCVNWVKNVNKYSLK